MFPLTVRTGASRRRRDREGCQTEEQAGAGSSSRPLGHSFARGVWRGACGNSFILTSGDE